MLFACSARQGTCCALLLLLWQTSPLQQTTLYTAHTLSRVVALELPALSPVSRFKLPAGHVVGQGERYFVLRLAPTGAAQLWDPLFGEVLCIAADEQRHSRRHEHQNRQQPADEDLWRQQLEILGALRSIAAEGHRLQQRAAMLRPLAERFAESRHRSLQQVVPAQTQHGTQLDAGPDPKTEEATLEELRHIEQILIELQANEDALIKEWLILGAQESCPSPFLIGGPRQKSREGLWPVARLSLLVSPQNAYINLQPMRCRNSRLNPVEASPVFGLREDELEEFVPVTASVGVNESEQHIRQSIRARLQRRHRWRYLGLPVFLQKLRRAARIAVSASWWLSCYIKCIGLMCCDRY